MDHGPAVANGRRQKVTGFLCYARDDAKLVTRLRRDLTPRLKIDRTLAYTLWSDDLILVGQRWDEEIRAALAAADFGLLLVSPAMLVRPYIVEVELPALVRTPGKVVVPVGLRRVDFERSNTQALEEHQVFLYRPPGEEHGRWFADLAGENPARFCDELTRQMTARLMADGA